MQLNFLRTRLTLTPSGLRNHGLKFGPLWSTTTGRSRTSAKGIHKNYAGSTAVVQQRLLCRCTFPYGAEPQWAEWENLQCKKQKRFPINLFQDAGFLEFCVMLAKRRIVRPSLFRPKSHNSKISVHPWLWSAVETHAVVLSLLVLLLCSFGMSSKTRILTLQKAWPNPDGAVDFVLMLIALKAA